MPRLCPECEEPYDRKIRGKRATVPEDGRLCHRDVEFEGDRNTGVWYVHE